MQYIEFGKNKAKVSKVVLGTMRIPQMSVSEVDLLIETCLDEGINMLTSQKTPDPAGWFGEPRAGEDSLYDVYNRILPILGDGLKRLASKLQRNAVVGKKLLVLQHQRVARLGEDAHEVIHAQLVGVRDDGDAAHQLGDEPKAV